MQFGSDLALGPQHVSSRSVSTRVGWWGTWIWIVFSLGVQPVQAQVPADSSAAGSSTADGPRLQTQVEGTGQRRGFGLGRYLKSIVYDTSGFDQSTQLVYPILLYAPETSLEIGLSFNYLFTLGRDTTTTRYSNVVPLLFYTLRGQYGLWVTNEIFTPREDWLILGILRFQNFPLYFYGIGPNASEQDEVTLDQTQLWVRQRVMRKLHGNWFGGLELEFKDVRQVSNTTRPEQGLPAGVSPNTVFGFGPAITYEGRHNPLNPEPSTYFAASWMSFDRWMGSTTAFGTITVDVRHYVQVFRRHILALQQYGIHQNGTPPFNLYAQLGGDMIMRGWYYGRFRDRNLWAQQIEYRHNGFRKLPRLGFAAFASMGAVATEMHTFSSRNLETAAGAGLRFQLFPKKDVNLRFDYALTREGSNFYVALGEAF